MEVFGGSWLVVSSGDGYPLGMTLPSASLLVSLAGNGAPHDLVTLASRPATEGEARGHRR
jgi:hypothetical protein